MNLHLARPARPFPVADRTRDGELYRTMHPRLAAIDLLREKAVDGRAGVDTYDASVFILDALPHEIVWARRCLLLCGELIGERELGRGRVRYRAILEADVRATLDLDEEPRRYVITDEPLASRGVEAPPEAILHVLHPPKPQLRLIDEPGQQECRDCGRLFGYDPDADRCPACVAVEEEQPVMRAALDRACQLAALRVDCGCGAPAGTTCGCTASERLASAALNRNEVH